MDRQKPRTENHQVLRHTERIKRVECSFKKKTSKSANYIIKNLSLLRLHVETETWGSILSLNIFINPLRILYIYTMDLITYISHSSSNLLEPLMCSWPNFKSFIKNSLNLIMAACVCTVDTQATYQKLRPWEKLTLPFPAAIIITSQLGVRVCVSFPIMLACWLAWSVQILCSHSYCEFHKYVELLFCYLFIDWFYMALLMF